MGQLKVADEEAGVVELAELALMLDLRGCEHCHNHLQRKLCANVFHAAVLNSGHVGHHLPPEPTR